MTTAFRTFESSWFQKIWWLSLAVKLGLALILPLAADEAYYWFWSHHLQWSYFDHPPMIAFLLWLGRPLENFGGAVRWPALILAHSSLIIWWMLLKNRLDATSLKTWTWLALFSPLIGFGSLVATPDLPLLFFWPLSLYCFDQALEKKSLPWYAALGLSLGLGFSSKYHIVLMVPVLLLSLTFEKRWREVRPHFLIMTILCGLAGSFPVLYWNATNEWQSFLFQIDHGLGRSTWKSEWTLSYLIGQILILGPWLIPALWRARKNPRLRLLFWNAAFIWGFFTFSSFKSIVEANWPIAAFPAAFALISSELRSKKILWSGIGLWIFLGILAGSQWVHPWIPGIPANADETRQYRELSSLVGKYEPLYANTYQMASILTFETKKPVPKLYDMSRFDFYDQLPESKPQPGPYFLIKREGQNLPKWVREGHNQIEVIEHRAPDFEILRIEEK